MTLSEAKQKRDKIIEFARSQGAHIRNTTDYKNDKEAYISVTATLRIQDKKHRTN
jgi:hypothetical protein